MGGKADLFAQTLNHLAGFRLNVYEKRGWNDVLSEPLEINRMKRETLDVMWKVISENKQSLVKYLKEKQSFLGLRNLTGMILMRLSAAKSRRFPTRKAQSLFLISSQISEKSSPLLRKKPLKTAGLKLKTDRERHRADFAQAFRKAISHAFL